MTPAAFRTSPRHAPNFGVSPMVKKSPTRPLPPLSWSTNEMRCILLVSPQSGHARSTHRTLARVRIFAELPPVEVRSAFENERR